MRIRVLGFALLFVAGVAAAARFDERFEFRPGTPQAGGQHGIAAAVDGDVAIAGAYFEDGGRGAVYVYERQRGGFAFRQRLTAGDRQPNDRFGLHVDVDEGTIAVGAIGSEGIGAVYIYTRDNAGLWVQRQRIVGARGDGGPAREAGDEFGVVALDGDDLVIGAPGTDFVGIILSDAKGARPKGSVTDAGAVYHFVRGGNGLYTQRDMVFEFGASSSNRFGESVDVERNRLVVGAINGDGAFANTGNAWVYTRSSPASSYFQTLGQEIFASDGTATDQFVNVRISGDTILVGARQEDVPGPAGFNHGAAYVFQFNGANFVQVQKLVAQAPASNDYYGNGVAIDGDVLMVGGPYGVSGFVEMWERSGGTWVRAATRLTARSTTPGDFLGASIGLSDNTAVFGAFGRDVAGQVDAGVVHVFERDEPSGLSRQRRFTTAIASEGDRGRFDLLGSSVAINERWLVAGAPGVTRFDAFSLSFVRTGVAYVFDRTSPAAPAVLLADLDQDDRFGNAVAITRDGRTVVVGATEAGSGNPGEIYVYTQPGGGWTGTLFATGPVAITVPCGFRDGFARSVAIGDDGLILVGSSLNTYGALPSVGAAYVLRPNGSGYDQFCIPAQNPAVSGQFGAEVAVEGRHLYIGAPEESRVYHYEMLASGPVFRHTIAGQTVSSDPVVAQAKGVIGNKFGAGIAAEGDTIVIGAPLADTSAGTDAGMAFVYEIDGTTIDATAELIGDKFGPGANAGASVATNGEVIVLGAPLADSGGVTDAGGVYAYEKPIDGWSGVLSEDGALDAPDPNTGGMFGFDVAATADAVAIGEPFDDGPTIDGVVADDQGSAFAFDFTELMLDDGFE